MCGRSFLGSEKFSVKLAKGDKNLGMITSMHEFGKKFSIGKETDHHQISNLWKKQCFGKPRIAFAATSQ